MRSIGKFIGTLIWLVSGIVIFIFWFASMVSWLGTLGGILAFAIAPGLVIFPIIFWIVEGVFPLLYFVIWGLGILGLIIVGASSKDD